MKPSEFEREILALELEERRLRVRKARAEAEAAEAVRDYARANAAIEELPKLKGPILS